VTWLRLFADVKAGVALQINSFSMAIMLAVILGAARLSDSIGRKPILAGAAIGLALFSWPLMALMHSGDIVSLVVGQLGFAVLIGSYSAVNPITMCEIFPRSVRCSAVSTAYNITVGALGGTAPMFATWLIAKTDYPLAPALYVTLAAALSAVAALSIRSRSTPAMDEVIPQVAVAT
jgi:MFS transporter, MHS family, proline/betaine transporter